jgi:hypothetical protein
MRSLMNRISKHLRGNAVAYVALFVALTGSSAYAAGTVFSEDIVDGQVKTPDLGAQSVTPKKLAPDAVNSGKVLDNSLKGDDIDEASLALSFQGTATVGTRRTTVPAGGASDQLVLDVPGFGEVRNKNCSAKSARSSFFNDTAKTVGVFGDISNNNTPPSEDPLFAELAPGEEAMGTEVEGAERAIYQAGFGSGRVATIVVMGRSDGVLCHYQAQAVID